MNDISKDTAECLRLISEATQTIIDTLFYEATIDEAVEATRRAAGSRALRARRTGTILSSTGRCHGQSG